MKVIADLEVHSKYSRAVSSNMDVLNIAEWAAKKGIDLVGTGDFTHPVWLRELEANLEEAGEGVYRLKSQISNQKLVSKVRFLLTSEVSCMYIHKGKGRRVHLMIYLPNFNFVKKFNQELTSHGANLFSDGRPIIGLKLAQVAEIALSLTEKALVIPAHIWTPWFGFYGQMSGYDSLTEAFGSFEEKILAVETGLSSDPAMNWKIAELKDRKIVSFGDAHSPQKLGREATCFELPEISYTNIYKAMEASNDEKKGQPKIVYTIEFYPEEGKYHYTGHRKCKVVYSPSEAKKLGLTCPVCGRSLTLGVASRVEELAEQDIKLKSKIDKHKVRFILDEDEKKTPYIMLVPLMEIISEAFGVGVATKAVLETYEKMILQFGSEFALLLETEVEEIEKKFGKTIAEGISRVRGGDIFIKPGYDGVFGEVKIWRSEKEIPFEKTLGQRTLF